MVARMHGCDRLRRVLETAPQLAQKLVFCNSDLDKSTAVLGQRATKAMVGRYLMGVYLTGVHVTSVYLIVACLMGVYLTGVHLMGVHLMGVTRQPEQE
jgi:hypothetical protein